MEKYMNAVAQQEKQNGTMNRVNFLSPEVNIFQKKDSYILEAEMPGVSKDGLEVTLKGNEITIIGHRQSENLKAEPIYRESRPVDYRRVFELDPAIDSKKISAKMEQGILTLVLPRTEQVKPRKINITN